MFETNRIAVIQPLLNNDIRLGVATSMSLLLMSLGYFGSGILSRFMDQKKMYSILLLLPGATAIWSWYEQYEKNTNLHFVLEAKASIGHSVQKFFQRRIAHLTSEFEINQLKASHLRQGPLESNALNFENVVAVSAKDGPKAFCVTTKDKTASVVPLFVKEKWLNLSICLPALTVAKVNAGEEEGEGEGEGEEGEEKEGGEEKGGEKKEQVELNREVLHGTNAHTPPPPPPPFHLQFTVEGAKRIVLRQETRQEKNLRRSMRGYKRQDVATSKTLRICVARKNTTKARIQQLLQLALEEHAADTLDQAIKMLDTRVITGKLQQPQDEYFQQAEVFRSAGNSSEIKRLLDTSFHWPLDDPPFHTHLSDLLQDAIVFDQSKEFYTLRGIPFRRSYLLSGPQASGKEYFVRYLAHKLGREICILDFSKLSHRLISNAGLAMAVNALGSNVILIMRHLDSLVSVSEGNAGRSSVKFRRDRRGRQVVDLTRLKQPLTYSGILNVLDGPCAHNNGMFQCVNVSPCTFSTMNL